jgi:hypothetical protein
MMNTEDLDAIMRGIAPVIKKYVEQSINKLEKELEARPIPSYAGVWRDGAAHRSGEIVTFQGSAWYCHVDTNSRPGTSHDWQLMVKAGRDGRDYITKEIK